MFYVAKLTPEKDGGYSVTFPDIPGCITQGDTKESKKSKQAQYRHYLTLKEKFEGKTK
jgi:hypothetical protein